MPDIADLPVELFQDGIFSFLPVPDILGLGCTNRFFSSLVADEAFWHRRIQEDFNFSGSDTARQTGWKFLYRRLSNPSLYVWGEKSKSRLGTNKFPSSSVRDGVPYPIRLDIPGVRIVSLVAGGMSFHAIDSCGDIYVWGVLDGTSMALRSDGFSDPSQKADSPMRLELPVKFRSISCGRLHTTALDATGQVWTFTSWGRPFRLSSALLDRSSPETTPVQVESGWSFSSVLTESGDVLVYWPFGGTFKRVIDEKIEEFDSSDNEEFRTASKARVSDNESHVIPCYWWIMHGTDPVRLPPIPATRLPVLPATGLSEDELAGETKLVKIAAFDNNILGLTNKGHVLRYGQLRGEYTFQEGRWEYLPLFSDITQIKDLEVYHDADNPLTPPENMLITHISASFHTFFAYSTGTSSAVFMGQHIPSQDPHPATPGPAARPPTNAFAPTILPALQNRSVISVVLGDYHYGALTGDGALLTWGAFSKGALGLGDPVALPVGAPGGFPDERQRAQAVHAEWGLMHHPPDVRTPSAVRFDHAERRKRPKYCFAAAALGWHMGALVIDLDPDEDGDQSNEVDMPGSFPGDGDEPPAHEPPPAEGGGAGGGMMRILPIGFGRGLGTPFRVGFAGRGIGRGGAPRM